MALHSEVLPPKPSAVVCMCRPCVCPLTVPGDGAHYNKRVTAGRSVSTGFGSQVPCVCVYPMCCVCGITLVDVYCLVQDEIRRTQTRRNKGEMVLFACVCVLLPVWTCRGRSCLRGEGCNRYVARCSFEGLG